MVLLSKGACGRDVEAVVLNTNTSPRVNCGRKGLGQSPTPYK